MATLTYNYADSTVVLGPLSRLAEPHTYDLCRRHAQSMTAPKGWELLRLELPAGEYRAPEPDDLLAVAHAVQPPRQSGPSASSPAEPRTPDAADRAAAQPPRERPEPIGIDGPARPGRPALRLLRDTEGPAAPRGPRAQRD